MKKENFFNLLLTIFHCINDFLKKIWYSNSLKIILIICIVFLLLIDFYDLSVFRWTPKYEQFGTVGDWFSNFITLITIIVAAITIINDKRIAESDRKYNQGVREADQLERERDRLEQQDMSSKAVYAWINGEQDCITGEITNLKLFLSNKTGAPVFEWEVYTTNHKVLVSSKSFGPLFPEVIREINIKQLKADTAVTIDFKSFNGKRWSRTNSIVKEDTHV